MVKTKCPYCNAENDVSPENIGKEVICSHCSRGFTAENPNLFHCPDCFALVSRRARNCPHCGAPLQSEGSDDKISALEKEQELFCCHPSAINYLGDILMMIICAAAGLAGLFYLPAPYSTGSLLAAAAVGVFFLLCLWIRIHFTEYRVTNLRVISCRGLVAKHQAEIWIRDMRGVKLGQTVWNRLLGIGNVAIGTAATAGEEIVLVGVSDPQKIVDLVNSLRR